jgi:hypothetical protein
MRQREMLNEEQLEAYRGSIRDGAYTSALVEKWERHGYMEGINDPRKRRIMGMLYENQMRWLKGLNEETRSTMVGAFQKHIFPMLRRVFPNLITPEIMSTQPMTAAVGAVFYFDFQYGVTKGASQEGGIFPRQNTFDPNYTSEYVPGEQIATGNGTDYGGAGAALNTSLNWSPVRPKGTYGGNVDINVVVQEINHTTGAVVQQALDDGNGGFTGDASAGAINYANGAIANFKFTAAVGNLNLVVVNYYYDGELNTKIPTVNMNIRKFPIEAFSHRVKSLWSAEAAEDFRSFHGIDAEAEMLWGVAAEMMLEIDRTNISNLMAAALRTTYYDGSSRTPNTDTWSANPAGTGISIPEHYQSIIGKIAKISNKIHKESFRSPADFIVTSPEISAILATISIDLRTRAAFVPGTGYQGDLAAPRPLGTPGQYGIYQVGTLMNRWTVYEDPTFASDKMLIGRKGDGFADAGAAYCPYVPLVVTPTFLDPADFTYRKGLRTRHGFQIVRPEFYGILTVTNMP